MRNRICPACLQAGFPAELSQPSRKGFGVSKGLMSPAALVLRRKLLTRRAGFGVVLSLLLQPAAGTQRISGSREAEV